ncbi:V/A-type H+-transporting ATPase subunit E [Lachnospiraceae bacterium NE2001]|jgi:V/A-type H+-transporting ATPase subunit E|nr:V/A-type H+-transporting ATPase subunit E [Lachnospiraceae bacterium NE2001]
MAGIESITKEINLEAEKEAASIISAAEEAANTLKAKTEEECSVIRSEAEEKIARKLAAEDKKTQSQCEQAEKLIMLHAKQEIIEEVLAKAKNKLLLLDTKDYFDTLLKLLDKQSQADKGVLLLNEKDLSRMPADFEKSAQAVATKNGGMLDVSTDTVNIDGGFILKYGNIEINSSFDALFEENEEELVDIVNKMLWA